MSETWITRLTYEDGHAEDVETQTGEDGCFTVVVPEGVTQAGPSWVKGARSGNDYQAEHGPEPAPVTFVVPGGTSMGMRR